MVPKPSWILDLISQKIGFDIADDIPDEHEEDAEFVSEQVTLPLKSGAREGTFTGWKRNGAYNGRGVFTSKDQMLFIEGRWANGQQHGIGWKFERYKTDDACILGHWKFGGYSSDMTYFDNNGLGTIKAYNDKRRGWVTL